MIYIDSDARCKTDLESYEQLTSKIESSCNCPENFNTPGCQLNLTPTRYSCRENATSSCRSHLAQLAKLYMDSPNAKECKEKDPAYKLSQDLLHSCNSEYILPRGRSLLVTILQDRIISKLIDIHLIVTLVCEDDNDWCELANPDCSRDFTQKNCQKFCGRCIGITYHNSADPIITLRLRFFFNLKHYHGSFQCIIYRLVSMGRMGRPYPGMRLESMRTSKLY